MKEVAIVSAVRTLIGNFGGTLRNVPAYDLSTLAIKEAVKRAGIQPDAIDLAIMGQNYQSGEYVNIARQSLLRAGWPESIPGISLDRRCPSGFDAICLGTTGARILTTLIYEMGRRNARYGLLAMCGGGGMGVAGVIERA
jgi:acetyl-CoA C-acetyltransferase